MFRVCYSEDRDRNDLSLWVRPDDLIKFNLENTEDLNVLIRNWQNGLTDLISDKIVSFVGDCPDNTIVRDLARAGGVFVSSLLTYFKDKLSGTLDPVVKATLSKFASFQTINVYIDDLDRGWEGKRADI